MVLRTLGWSNLRDREPQQSFGDEYLHKTIAEMASVIYFTSRRIMASWMATSESEPLQRAHFWK